MKKKVALLCCTIVVSVFFICKKMPIQGLVTYTESYCGGAAPPEYLLKELNTPKPLANKKIYLKKGKENSLKSKIIYELTSNDKGQFEFYLPDGDYILVDDDKKDSKKYLELLKVYGEKTRETSAIDKGCLDKWLTVPDFSFSIKKSISNKPINVNYNTACSWNRLPCVNYTGQLPP